MDPVILFITTVAPATAATAFLTTVQLFASLAGRGRALPGLRFVPAVRAAVALALAVPMVALADGVPKPLGIALACAFVGLCETSSRLGGPSVVTMTLGLSVLPLIYTAGIRDPHAAEMAWASAFVALASIATLMGLAGGRRGATISSVSEAVRQFDRRRLALVGITPWAGSEVALFRPSWSSLRRSR